MKKKCKTCGKIHHTNSKYCSDRCVDLVIKSVNKEAKLIELQRLKFLEELKLEMLPPKHIRKKRKQLFCGSVLVDDHGRMLS
jgi:endogenous inhibitor of DNA gyrase (YacG/DUF329 family)